MNEVAEEHERDRGNRPDLRAGQLGELESTISPWSGADRTARPAARRDARCWSSWYWRTVHQREADEQRGRTDRADEDDRVEQPVVASA